jgi:SAM-dependent methyltransferase
MLDELAHAGPEHLDEEFIAGYDRKQGYPDPAADLEAFMALGLDGTSTVIDFAAGTGQFAVAAARRFGRVTAVDVSPAMLGALRAKAAGTGLECVRGGFLSYSPAGYVDGIYTRNALHQIPDFWKVIALRRLAGMLRPGGVLRLRDLIYDFEPGETDAVFGDWFAGAAADPADGYTAADYAEHIRTEYSTFRTVPVAPTPRSHCHGGPKRQSYRCGGPPWQSTLGAVGHGRNTPRRDGRDVTCQAAGARTRSRVRRPISCMPGLSADQARKTSARLSAQPRARAQVASATVPWPAAA